VRYFRKNEDLTPDPQHTGPWIVGICHRCGNIQTPIYTGEHPEGWCEGFADNEHEGCALDTITVTPLPERDAARNDSAQGAEVIAEQQARIEQLEAERDELARRLGGEDHVQTVLDLAESARRAEQLEAALRECTAQLNKLKGAVMRVMPPDDVPEAWTTDLLALKEAFDHVSTIKAQEARAALSDQPSEDRHPADVRAEQLGPDWRPKRYRRDQPSEGETERIYRCDECGWQSDDTTPDAWGTRCPGCGNAQLAYLDRPVSRDQPSEGEK